jgi:hypothetical protein
MDKNVFMFVLKTSFFMIFRSLLLAIIDQRELYTQILGSNPGRINVKTFMLKFKMLNFLIKTIKM